MRNPHGFDHPAFEGLLVNPGALDLVHLSELPESTWPGRVVFHPHQQREDHPIWKATSRPEDADYDEQTAGSFLYDVGMVLTSFADPDFARDGDPPRVRFVGSDGGTLQYAATNLWTPRWSGS